jgi:hypothetical protein
VAKGRCGDGVCDEAEQANAGLCPQDCAEATEPPAEVAPTPTLAPTAEAPEPAGKCGDGICDEVEQKDANLCPQDCAATAEVEASPTEEAQAEPTTAPTDTPVPEPTAAPTDTPLPEPTATEAVAGRESTTSPAGELAFVGDLATVEQDVEAGEPPQSNLAFILDGSGSMGEGLPGTGKTKLAVAKEVMAELIPQIPEEMNGTLWIYAHRKPPDPKAESCKDIEQVFPLGPVDDGAWTERIEAIQANGWTPIADSIIAAAEAMPTGDFNSLILVSDGEETCGGDPCAVAKALKGSDAELTIHVVGYAVDDATREQLECIAAVSGGSYHDAADAEGLLQALEEALAATVVETILRVEVVGPDGAEVHQNIHLYEAGSDHRVSAYSAWQDNVVPPGTYDLLVDTLPDLVYPNLELPEHSTTIVRIILGAVTVLSPEGDLVPGDIYDAGSDMRLGYWGHEGPVTLVPGVYHVQVTGSTSAPITVQAGETQELVLGAITVVSPDGEPVPADFYEAASGARLGYWGHEGPVMLVPGTYQVQVTGSTSAPVTLEAGETKDLLLGAIQVEGQAEFWDADGKRLGFWGDTVLLVPGTYTVELGDGTTVENVVAEAGKVTEVK